MTRLYGSGAHILLLLVAALVAVGACDASSDGSGDEDACVPACEGLECGDDGCGGSCGTCPAAAPLCSEGLCAASEPEQPPELVVVPEVVDFGPVGKLQRREQTVSIVGVGTGRITLRGLALGGAPGYSATFLGEELGTGPGEARTTMLAHPISFAPGDTVAVTVAFEPASGGAAEATLGLITEPAAAPGGVIVALHGVGKGPVMGLSADALEFEEVPVGASLTRKLTVSNDGTSDLDVTVFVKEPHPAFSVLVGDGEWPVELWEGSQEAPRLTVEPGSSGELRIRFTPQSVQPAAARIVLATNDPWQPKVEMPLAGSTFGSCLLVEPHAVDFGGVMVGQAATREVHLVSCDAQAVKIQEVALLGDGSPEFGLAAGAPGDAPFSVPPGETVTVEVTYEPTAVGPFDADGLPLRDQGRLRIVQDGDDGALEVPLRGFGTDHPCPTAIIDVAEGDTVLHGSRLHLVGSGSTAQDGAVAEYEWSVEQPEGAVGAFLPSPHVADPMFDVFTVGTYLFRLQVRDDEGVPACAPATYAVEVRSGEALHIELLWHTPLDPDETDEGPEAGTDLDLHLAHPYAAGEDVDGDGEPDGWFDQPHDCFWFNAHPNWGSLDPEVDDDPGLTRDDTDGAGPEIIDFTWPEPGLTYRVGVHYWNDHSFGPSLATVRIYRFGDLVWEGEAELINHDLWEVATIAWPSGEVEAIEVDGGEQKIIPGYQHPFFPND